MLTLLATIAGCLLGATLSATAAFSQTSGHAGQLPTMNTAGLANPPIGHITFCKRHPEECVRHGKQVAVTLDNDNWQDLLEVNHQVNRKVLPVTDLEFYKTEEYWTLPAQYGDCEDYVLLKRRKLIAMGWPTGALLVTVVYDENNEGHAILLARTDRGEFVLDNKVSMILPWYETPYRYVKRQSVENPRQWVSIDDRRRMEDDVASIR